MIRCQRKGEALKCMATAKRRRAMRGRATAPTRRAQQSSGVALISYDWQRQRRDRQGREAKGGGVAVRGTERRRRCYEQNREGKAQRENAVAKHG